VLQDSQRTYTLKATGIYMVEATSLEPTQRGSYSISLAAFSRNAQLISQNAPTQVTAGTRFHYLITMRNTGSTTWASNNGSSNHILA
jgi:hypothetical protein